MRWARTLPAISLPSLHRRAFREGGRLISRLTGPGTQALRPITASAVDARGATVATGSKRLAFYCVLRLFHY